MQHLLNVKTLLENIHRNADVSTKKDFPNAIAQHRRSAHQQRHKPKKEHLSKMNVENPGYWPGSLSIKLQERILSIDYQVRWTTNHYQQQITQCNQNNQVVQTPLMTCFKHKLLTIYLAP